MMKIRQNKDKISVTERMKEILTLKSTLNFFKLSICFLWSGAMEGTVGRERDWPQHTVYVFVTAQQRESLNNNNSYMKGTDDCISVLPFSIVLTCFTASCLDKSD